MTFSEPSAPFAVLCNHSCCRERAADVARRLNCALVIGIDPAELDAPEFVLWCAPDGLALQHTGPKAPGPVRVDLLGGAVEHRRKFGGGKGQMIAKAVGVKAGVYPQVTDLTAGLGRDGFVLASLGCKVTLVERSPVVALLLEDGLARARAHAEEPAVLETLKRIELIHSEGRDYLAGLEEQQLPEVIYLDPMFPERDKSAQVKKEMRAFHQLVGRDEDAAELLGAALEKARYRVLVKRPRKAPPLVGRPPSYELSGKSSRYDIYALRKLPERLT